MYTAESMNDFSVFFWVNSRLLSAEKCANFHPLEPHNVSNSGRNFTFSADFALTNWSRVCPTRRLYLSLRALESATGIDVRSCCWRWSFASWMSLTVDVLRTSSAVGRRQEEEKWKLFSQTQMLGCQREKKPTTALCIVHSAREWMERSRRCSKMRRKKNIYNRQWRSTWKRGGWWFLWSALGDGFAGILKCVDSQCGTLMATLVGRGDSMRSVGAGNGFLSSRRRPRRDGMRLTRCCRDLEWVLPEFLRARRGEEEKWFNEWASRKTRELIVPQIKVSLNKKNALKSESKHATEGTESKGCHVWEREWCGRR